MSPCSDWRRSVDSCKSSVSDCIIIPSSSPDSEEAEESPSQKGNETLQGPAAIGPLGPARTRPREVTTLHIWCYCFLAYIGMHTTDATTRDQLAYARLIIKEAQRHGGLGWLDYDRAFRQQAEADRAIRWNTLLPGLQASTILGRPAISGQRGGPYTRFCTLCREVDHNRVQCALACLEPAGQGTPEDPKCTP